MGKQRIDPAVASRLLTEAAAALTALEAAGMKIKLRHNAVFTDYGYVLPTDSEWVARTLVYTEFEPLEEDDL
jgi:hypothetical protein